MANIEKRRSKTGELSYRAKVRLKGFEEQSATFERLTDAKKWAAATESAIREGRHFKTSKAKQHTLGELIARYKRDVLPTKPKSAKDQERQLDWWAAVLGHKTLADVTPALLAEARDKLASGMLKDGSMTVEAIDPKTKKPVSKPVEPRQNATVVRYLAALSHAFSVAVREWDWLESSPISKVTKPKQPRGRVRFLSDEEREELLKACKASRNPDLYTAVVLALSTGARQMEIMGLRWKQVDIPRGTITLYETKNNEIRALPLVGRALELMRERAKVRQIDTDLVFPGKPRRKLGDTGPATYRPVDLRTPFETALRKAKITDFRWHDLRHTFASYLAMNGATLAEIAEALGHKTLAMVKRYSHLSQAHMTRVVERMNARVFGV
jgi:integrase